MATFIRIPQPLKMKELLVNVDHISKIEVQYVVRSNDPNDKSGYVVDLRRGIEDPAAMRIYCVFVAGEELRFPGIPDDPVIKVIQDIYEKAIS